MKYKFTLPIMDDLIDCLSGVTSSPGLTWRVDITGLGLEKGMSGRQPSRQRKDYMSGWLHHLGSPIHQVCSWCWWTKCWSYFWGSLLLFTSTTFLFLAIQRIDTWIIWDKCFKSWAKRRWWWICKIRHMQIYIICL